MLAHQGGWDEAIVVAIPIVLFAGLLWIANRRARAQLAADDLGEKPRGDTERE